MTATSDGDIWRIFFTLTELTSSEFRAQAPLDADREACLRRVLRPHDEAGFTGPDERDMIQWREQLDKALGEITLREIRRELDLPYDPLPPETQDRLLKLFRSQAFLRYLDAYFYFGVRFVPNWPEFIKVISDHDPNKKLVGEIRDQKTAQIAILLALRPAPCLDANVTYAALAAPPELKTIPDAARIFQKFENLVRRNDEGEVNVALRFLDGFDDAPVRPVLVDLKEPTEFELWLRGLRPETGDAQAARFRQIANGITQWAGSRADFYLRLTPQEHLSVRTDKREAEGEARQLPETRTVRHPAAARLALADIYWIAKIFRSDISPGGAVSYQKYNWLHLLRFRATFEQDRKRVDDLQRAEEVLRSVFDYVCDLIQNSVEITDEVILHKTSPWEATDRRELVVGWRSAFDEELKEIEKERGVRHYRDPTLAPQATTGDMAPVSEATEGRSERSPASAGAAYEEAERVKHAATAAAEEVDADHRWSRRLLGSPRPADLVGLAFSGGGIRSATLNLGVLQGLQELDLLRHFDYISTVSGGGFIGSWLIANVRRSAHWLGRLTDWSASIEHLRKYSNYLAPRTGFLSPDTLNIANTWLRNTILMQLSALAWLFVLLLTALATMRGFLWAGANNWLDWVVLGFCAASVLVSVVLSLGALPVNPRGTWVGRVRVWLGQTFPRMDRILTWLGRTRAVIWCGVLPAWIGAVALTSRLWVAASPSSAIWPCLQSSYAYSEMLVQAWKYRPWWILLLASAFGFGLLAWQTLQRERFRRVFWIIVITVICTGVLYLELVAIFYLFCTWTAQGNFGDGLAFAFGPPLALIAFSACILLLIGISSKNTNEAQREWWTRYGTWLAIYAGAGFFICGVALFGPWMVLYFFNRYSAHVPVIPWTTVLGWMGTVVGGLFAGKSSQTGSDSGSTKARVLENFAKAAGVVFILGSFLLGSTFLYVLLFLIFGPDYPVIGSDPLQVFCEFSGCDLAIFWTALLLLGWLFSRRFEINIFGFSQFYRNRLVRCYLGASRWMAGARKPNPFMKFDFRDDMKLWRFRTDSPGEDPSGSHECDPYRGPFPLLNCSLNLAGSSDLGVNTRHGASFTLTPLRCGSDRPRVGYAPTFSPCRISKSPGGPGLGFADGVSLGQTVAVSGAAVSSNMGYNTSTLVAFLLTMFNVRLGWWFPNPGKDKWRSRGLTSSLRYLITELFGAAGEKRDFVNVSDGGHFENLGIYELVRRRCRLIIACDAECDPDLQFGSLGKMIRICATDFGADIDLNVDSIRPQENGLSLAHCAVGTIKYCTGEIGRLIYLKASMTGDEDVSIAQYRSEHPSFPHESTANQFYSEDQFESYRRLGLEMVRTAFKGNLPGDDPILLGERMFDVLTPAALSSEKFLRHAKALNKLWEIFRKSPGLSLFMDELMASSLAGLAVAGPPPAHTVAINPQEFSVGLQLIQLMEDVFLDLKLDDYWEHPDYRGWAILFMRWARSKRFREIWKRTHRTFGIRFEYFCNANLGLERDYPIARI